MTRKISTAALTLLLALAACGTTTTNKPAQGVGSTPRDGVGSTPTNDGIGTTPTHN